MSETPHATEDTMDSIPISIVSKFSGWWKVGSVLALAIGAGLTAGAYLTGYAQVPDQIRAHDARIEALELAKTASEVDARQWRASVDQRFERLECLVISQRRQTPVEDCL